jgi:hypothetical protein
MLALALVAALVSADDTRLPPNITVPARLAAIVADALHDSPKFREQCAAIGRLRRVRVRVDLDAADQLPGSFESRAHTHFQRFQYGAINAAVRLRSIRNAAELLAHELEHVREFAEGIDYRVQAVRAPHAVWRIGPDTFETVRAILAGYAVADEIAGRRTASTVAKRR